MPCSNPVRKKKSLGTVYRPRNHETPFFKIVRDHFDDFEKVYPERYQAKYGYWRPVIRSSIYKFLKCGDLKEGFARVRCPDCHAAFDTVREVYALEIDGDLGIPAMIGAVQTFGDLIHWHPHIHAIVADGVFTETGHFVRIPDTWKHRAIDIWRDKVFDMLLDEKKIDPDTVSGMKEWKNSGFSVDNSVIIEADDKEGISNLWNIFPVALSA